MPYVEHLTAVMIQNDVNDSAKLEGRLEGRLEGKIEGRLEGKIEGRLEGIEQERLSNARKMKDKGLDSTMIADITGLSLDEIAKL